MSSTRAVALLALTLLLGLVGTANAASPTWLSGQITEQTANASINGLSCPTPTTCLAAASNIPVVQDNGPLYEPDPDPDPAAVLNDVSCAPASDFCMFVDGSGGAFSYSNGTFASVTNIDGNTGIESVSCPSPGFCMAIDDNNKVFEYANGSWDGGHQNLTGAHSFDMSFVDVSCASTSYCVAMAHTSDGEEYYTWTGSTWSLFGGPIDAGGGPAANTISLSCTSTTYCLETDEAGYAAVFNGSTWSAPQHVDNPMGVMNPLLHSACVGTNCVAVDNSDNFIQTSDGQNWTAPTNIGSQTGLTAHGVDSLACATATLCVLGDGEGNTSTYSVPPSPTTPALSPGSAAVGQTLTLTHGSVQNPPVWYYDDWFRCANPGVTCSINPISTSPSGYTLVAADAGQYIEARETVGFGFDEEGYLGGDMLNSNIVGPISSGGGAGGGGGGGGGTTGGGGGTTSTTSTTTTTTTTTTTSGSGATRCRVPNLVGSTVSAARAKLSGAHCALGKTHQARSRRVKPGHIISQSHKAGQVLPAGTKVDVVVSAAKKKKKKRHH